MKWPTVEDATRRINILIGDQAETDMAARDLIVLMRELGRVTAENNHLKYERQEIIDNALEEQAALTAEPASGEAKEQRLDREELDRANAAIQKAAMAMGSTDEWADQEAMIGDFEERFAAIRQHADEATRNENIGCAALVERLLQRAYPMDSAYEPIVAAIRARIAR